MRILQICNKPPYPANDGGALAMHMLTVGLHNCGHSVKVLSLNTPKHPFLKKDLPASYIKSHQPQSTFINSIATPFGAITSVLREESYHVNRFFSIEFESLIKKNLKEFEYDIILLESLFVTPYIKAIRESSSAKIIYRAHNVESQLWKTRLSELQNPIKYFLLQNMLKKLTSYEENIPKLVDGIAAITNEEKEYFKKLSYKLPCIAIPFGIETKKNISNPPQPISLFYIGALDWEPNIQGIKWFLTKVWPIILKKNSQVKLYIAGRNAIPWFNTISVKNVEFIGEVASSEAFMSNHSIMINPLFSGGGMRVKIIECLAQKRVVVSTSVGAEGIPLNHNKEIMIADNEKDFAKNIFELINNKDLLDNIANEGAKFVENNFSSTAICKRLSNFMTDVLN